MTRARGWSLVAVVVLSAATVAAGQDLTRTEAASMERKLAVIIAPVPPRTPRPRRITFTEREVNSYFKYNGSSTLPVGVVDPLITIVDGGRVEARAVVDIEAIRKSKPRNLLDPINLLALIGTAEVRAKGRVSAANGKGTFEFESGTVAGISISKSVLQMIVSHYTAAPGSPDGFDLDKPFDLPVGIRSVETTRGAATIIQ
jgi:hypothetical protein